MKVYWNETNKDVVLNKHWTMIQQIVGHTAWIFSTYDSGNLVNIGLDKGLSVVHHSAITWTNADLLSFGNKLQWNMNKDTIIFIKENAFENDVCKMAAILSGPHCGKQPKYSREIP